MRGVGGVTVQLLAQVHGPDENGEEGGANERFHAFAICMREAGTHWARMQETEAPRCFWKYLPSC